MSAASIFAVLALNALNQVDAQVLNRTAITTLSLPPEPTEVGFTTERTLNNLGFDQPVAIVSPPGETNRLFIVEKPGRIIVIPDLSNPARSTFLDLTSTVIDSGEEGLLALAFHPEFASNGFFYVYYTLNTSTDAGNGRHDRLSRFQVSAGNPNQASAASEIPLITQFDQASNHNGGQLTFGPDGYLYLSLGDEGNGNDSFQNGQRIDRDFFSCILRLDVDQRPGSLPPNAHPAVHAGTYRVPPDNPFVGATSFNGAAVNPANVRTEFWAIGLRNPWRMAFDSLTGYIWVGDVGQNAHEEIDLVTAGRHNFGWPFREGFSAGPGGSPPAGASLTDPIHDYPRSEGTSVTGGLVYRGTQFSQLYGAYLFADYDSGRIWSLRYDGSLPAQIEQLTTNAGIVSFGINPANGDILLANINQGSIRRLIHDGSSSGAPFPATLSETGAFTSVANLTPATGLVAYEPNVSFWSDHARKRRWFGLPEGTTTFGFDAFDQWTFPAGAVWLKHFDLELTRGDPATARRIETRFLVKTAEGVYGLSYRWNDAQTEATLVGESGADADFTITESGTPRTQTWHFPSRAECLTCHTAAGGLALSFNTRQLNRDHEFPGGTANQLVALAEAGYLDTSAVPPVGSLPKLAAGSDIGASVELRARSYLDANCAQCHQPGGTALGSWDARSTTPLSIAGIINGALTDDDGDPANRVIVPGDTTHSRLLHRVAASNGTTRMPPLATNERDTAAEALLAEWIAALAAVEPDSGHLINTSARALVGTGNEILIPGIVIGGSQPKTVLIRSVGPSLARFDIVGFLAEPTLTLFSGQTPIASNTRWNTASNADEIRSVSAQLGAFTLPEGSADSALLVTLNPGLYTAHTRGLGDTTGVALMEVYDAEPNSTASRLINLSARAQIGSGEEVLIPGLVVGPGDPVTVLVRAVGPGLEQFDIPNFLPAPALTLFSGNDPVVTNVGWSTAANDNEIAAAGALVGAFRLGDSSADSAVLVTLNPGSYTLHVSSSDGAPGVALVEVYEVP